MIRLAPVETFAMDGVQEGGTYSSSPVWQDYCYHPFGYCVRRIAIERDGLAIGGFSYTLVRSRLFGNRIISMPFSDETALFFRAETVLSEGERQDVLEQLVSILDEEAARHRADYAEIRGWHLLFAGAASRGFMAVPRYTKFVLDTARPYEHIRENYDSNIIKNLRKADRCVAVRLCAGVRELEEPYGIYLVQMRRFGSPPLPQDYFTGLFEAGLIKVFLAVIDRRVVGFLSTLIFAKGMYADINASLPRYKNFFPKIRLFDASIRFAAQNNITFYDFMRTRRPSGVYDHKKKWGGDERDSIYFYRRYNRKACLDLDPDEPRFRLPRFLFSKMPLFLSRRIGPFLRGGLGK